MELIELLNENNQYTYKSPNFSIKRILKKHLTKIELEQDKETFTYLGGVDLNFERSEIGLYKFQNGDIYLGNWKNNLKEGIGLFYTIQIFADNKIFFNFYFGNWAGNAKNGNGIYLRILINPELSEKNKLIIPENNNSNSENYNSYNVSNLTENGINNNNINNNINNKDPLLINENEIERLEIFCGLFKEDEFIEGLNYFVSGKNEENEESIYYGKMNYNFEKHDPNGIFLTRHNKFIYKGNFKENKFTNGYAFNIDDEPNKLFYVEYEDNEVIEYKNKNNIEDYDIIYNDLIKKYLIFNDVSNFNEIIKYANLTDYYIEHLINYDFDKFTENYEFLTGHISNFKDMYDNIMDLFI